MQRRLQQPSCTNECGALALLLMRTEPGAASAWTLFRGQRLLGGIAERLAGRIGLSVVYNGDGTI